jgi:hypothetical protein
MATLRETFNATYESAFIIPVNRVAALDDQSFNQSFSNVEELFIQGLKVKVNPTTLFTLLMGDKPFAKESPSGLAEEIEELGRVGSFIFIKDINSSEIKKMSNKFYLQNMEMSFKEKAQIANTFGVPSVFLFGDSVKIYSFSGVALDYKRDQYEKTVKIAGGETRRIQKTNSHDYYHGSSLIKLYNEHMRGTKLVDNNQISIIKILNHTIWGYPLNFTARKSATRDNTIEFGMSWLVTDHSMAAPGIVTEKNLEDSNDVMSYLGELNKALVELIKRINEYLDITKKIIELHNSMGSILVGDLLPGMSTITKTNKEEKLNRLKPELISLLQALKQKVGAIKNEEILKIIFGNDYEINSSLITELISSISRTSFAVLMGGQSYLEKYEEKFKKIIDFDNYLKNKKNQLLTAGSIKIGDADLKYESSESGLNELKLSEL